MATSETMTIDERYKYLRIMQPRYLQADRTTQSEMLDEMEAVTGLHRKSLIRRLNGKLTRKPRAQQRGVSYGPEVDEALALIWKALDYVCPERLQPNLVSMGELLARHGELTWSPSLAAQLAQISISSVRRHLPPLPVTHRRRKSPAPENRHQRAMPAYRIARDIGEPGHLELDLVHHCGGATDGEYVHTLHLVDVATGWSACRAILGRSYLVIRDALADLLPRLPFPIREVHPDNGSEFLNDQVRRFLTDAYPDAVQSRSRGGQPNDNRLVEEKNGSLVRYYLGDRRLDTVVQTRFLNTLYTQIGQYHNFMLPVMKQIAKEWKSPTADRQGYVKRYHDTARPPLDRLCALVGPDSPQCQTLLTQRQQLNPLALSRAIYDDVAHLFTYPNAAPDQVEDVFETLADPDRWPAAVAARGAVDTVDKPNPGLPTVPTAPTTTETQANSRKETA
jgi:transposase InsO family protein